MILYRDVWSEEQQRPAWVDVGYDWCKTTAGIPGINAATLRYVAHTNGASVYAPS